MPIPDLDKLIGAKQYTGMRVSETAVVRAWLLRHGNEFDRIEFAVRVGEGAPPGVNWTPEEIAAHRHQTAKRIDFMVWSGLNPMIVEAKPRILTDDLGQILTYRVLWLRDNPDAPEPALLIIGQAADPDVQYGIRTHGVDLELYPELL